MIPLLLDAGLPRGSARDLRASGWDALHVSDHGLGAAPDAAILKAAAAEGRAIVTLDNDFPQILYLTGAAGPSMILICIEGLDRPVRDRGPAPRGPAGALRSARGRNRVRHG